MNTWNESFDLSTVPDAVLWAEVGRRRSASRKVRRGGPGTGRVPVLRPCPHCGVEFKARDMRVHEPRCKRGAARKTKGQTK